MWKYLLMPGLGWAVSIRAANPYDEKSLNAHSIRPGPVTVYTLENPPAYPPSEDLPLRESVTQSGVTWTFAKPTRVGDFLNGDWYVLGPVTIQVIAPRPFYADEIPVDQLDHMDLERPEAQRVRNGFMLNPPPQN